MAEPHDPGGVAVGPAVAAADAGAVSRTPGGTGDARAAPAEV